MPYLKSYRSIFLFLSIFLFIFIVQGQGNSPQIDSNLNDSLLVDRDGDGRLDAGDTLRYTLEITNCGTAAAENVQFTGQADPNTQFIAESVQVGAPQPAATCPPQGGANPDNNGNGNPVPASGAPEVRNHTPDDGDTEVALNSNITVRFNKRVDVTGDWFEIVCSISGTFNISSGNVTVTGTNGINFTFDPNIDLQVGETCTVTIFAANVQDRDNNDPPDNMVADYVFSFTTETPPTVASTNPTNGATAFPNTDDIVITFDEPVTVTAASFTLECPAGTPFAGGFAVTGTGTATVTIDPTGNLPSGTTCQVVVVAANVSDVDANDPPDLLDGNGDNVEGDDYTFSFTTDIDAAPTVISVTPANGSVSVPSNTNITITFSELVDIPSAAAFMIECPAAGPLQGFTVITPATLPASTTTVVIDPAALLPDATTCQVTVFAAQVTDTDTDEPPDNMAADFVWSFTTEAAPSVTTTNPANGATGIGTGSNITIDFDEPVNVSTSSFTIECPAGGTSYTYTVAGSGTNSITLDPTTNLLANQTCTVTVLAAQVADTDLIDPPDNMVANYVFSFDTIADTAPTALSPLDGATGVATASNIVINFNEPVDVTAGAFVVECPVGTPVAFTTIPALPTTNQTSITIDPSSLLPATSTCAVTVLAANVTDTDADEPPDNMAADYSFTFDTIVDFAPVVDQPNIAPASTSTGANSASLDNPVSTTFTITIPFSEAVDAATGAFTLTCNATPVTVTTSPALPALGQTSIDVSPAVPIAEGANCVLTVVATNINDSDTDDPPNFMVTNFTLSFSGDTAPAETLTETEVGGVFQDVTGAGATNVDLDSDIQITFDEAVTVTFPANGLQCPAGNNIPVTVTTNNAATIVLNPDVNLPLNTLCVLNIPAANISDVDTADAPDNPLAAVNHSFTTVDDDAPTVTTNPAAGGSNIAVNSNITVTFNEPVTLTGAWFDMTCTVSGNRVSTGELTGTGITIIENTPDLVYTIDPTVDLGAGDICTITIDSANVVDNDVIDPPNELDGDASADIVDGDADDYTAIFSTQDMPPQVLSTTPAAAATVGAGDVVTINFTETVDVAAGAFTFECPAGTPLSSGFNTSVALPATGITTIDLTPVDPLPFGVSCTVTIDSSLVTDVDPIDPPNFLDGDNSGDLIDDADNFVLTFTVDAEPALLSSEVEIGGVLSPAAGAVNVDLDTNIVLTFSEAVNADLTSFDLECPAGTDIAFAVLGTGTTTITVDPTPAFLSINTLCDFDIIAANITDVDTFDAPDNLPADINFTFTTVNDDFPDVTTAEVEVGGVFTALPLAGTYADADTDLRITFSEAVTVTGNWAELNCTLSGIQDVTLGLAVTDADPVFTLNPATNLTAGEDCTLTVFAAQIDDDDAIDPPTNMLADAVFTFTVLDTPPQVDTATSTPADGDIVANSVVVTLNFTEMVDIAAGAISFECNAVPVPFTPALPQANVTTITLTPSAALDNGAACTVTLESTLITDDDTADAPDELDGDLSNDIVDGDADDFVLNFTVDLPPTVTTKTVEVAGVPTNVPLGVGVVADLDTNIVINFSEPIDSTAAGVTLECPAGTPIAFAGLPVTNGTTITLNPGADLPGDTLCTVTVVAANTTDTDTFDAPNQLDGNADTIEGDDHVFTFTTQAAAIDDAYTVTPHLTYDSNAAGLSVRDNDQPTTVAITGFGDTLGSANGTAPNGTNFITAGGAGGRIIMNADGTFLFYPDAGDTAASGTVTFFYTVTGGDTAQVTLTFEAEELVWFVDNSTSGTVCTGTNVGTQACPAATIAAVDAIDTASDTIFIASGSYTCGITLLANEKVIGDGSSSDLQTLSGVSPVAGSNFNPYSTFSGTDPVLTSSAADCITLATGNLIQGITIGDTGNFAGIVGTNYGTVNILETTINGTGQILNLDTGTVNATFDSLSSSSSDNSFAALRVANSTANFTSTGGTTVNGSAATVEAILLIQNTGTGFNLGATSVNKTTAGRGVVLGNGIVQSAPVTFASLAITTGAGTALEMNRQTGTVTVTANTGAISATSGAAVNIINTTGNTTPLALNLGALSANASSVATTCLTGTSPAGVCVSGGTGTMTASSVTVTTGTNRYGMRINNSSAAFTFATVNISGMTGTSAEADTSPNDGYPDNTTTDGDGIFLSSNTGSFTVNGGNVSNTNSSGADNVDIRSSSNIVFSGVTLSSAGKSNFQAINMTGTGSFNNGSISGAAVATNTDGFYFRANTGTLTRFDIDNTNCTMPSTANAEDCFEFLTSGTHTALVDIGGVGDTGVWRSNTNVVEAISQGTSSLTLNMESIDASPSSAGLAGMLLAAENTSTIIFRVLNNNFTNIGDSSGSWADGVIRILPIGTSTTRGRFQGNTVDYAASGTYARQTVRVASADALSTMELYINNNTLEAQNAWSAIFFKTECFGCLAQSSGDIFIQNNIITTTNDASGIILDFLDEAGSSGLRFNVSNNTITGGGATAYGISVILEDEVRNVDVTMNNNNISGTFIEVDAITIHPNNNFCLNITNHASDDINLFNGGGTFEVVNYPSIAANNPGSTIDDFGTTITNVGACSTPTSSGLVSEDSMDERFASLPEAQDEDNLMLSIMGEAFSFGAAPAHAQSNNFNIPIGPINIGTIPPNSSVTVTFDVMVNAVVPNGTSSVSLQGIISGSNFGSILTDDPETPLDMDATITALDSLQAVSALPQTGEDNWWQTAVIWGLRLALLSLVVAALIAIRRRFFRRI